MLTRRVVVTVAVAAAAGLAAACSSPADGSLRGQPGGPGARGGDGGTAAEDLRPYPYTTPTPPPVPSDLDRAYARTITPDLLGAPGKCRRCPPYRLAEGEERLTLDRGVFRIAQAGGDLTVGHALVDGPMVTFFNDPNCPTARGTYRWRLEGGILTFTLVEDDCAFGNLRARYLTAAPWRAAPPGPAPGGEEPPGTPSPRPTSLTQ